MSRSSEHSESGDGGVLQGRSSLRSRSLSSRSRGSAFGQYLANIAGDLDNFLSSAADAAAASAAASASPSAAASAPPSAAASAAGGAAAGKAATLPKDARLGGGGGGAAEGQWRRRSRPRGAKVANLASFFELCELVEAPSGTRGGNALHGGGALPEGKLPQSPSAAMAAAKAARRLSGSPGYRHATVHTSSMRRHKGTATGAATGAVAAAADGADAAPPSAASSASASSASLPVSKSASALPPQTQPLDPATPASFMRTVSSDMPAGSALPSQGRMRSATASSVFSGDGAESALLPPYSAALGREGDEEDDEDEDEDDDDDYEEEEEEELEAEPPSSTSSGAVRDGSDAEPGQETQGRRKGDANDTGRAGLGRTGSSRDNSRRGSLEPGRTAKDKRPRRRKSEKIMLCKRDLAVFEADVLLAWPAIFRPDLDRSSVLSALQNAPDGDFIVRPSGQFPLAKALCFCFGGIVLHFLIERFDGLVDGEVVRGGLRLSGQPLVFGSLAQLIAFHMEERGGLPCVLRLPQLDESAESPGVSRRSSLALDSATSSPGELLDPDDAPHAAAHSTASHRSSVQLSGTAMAPVVEEEVKNAGAVEAATPNTDSDASEHDDEDAAEEQQGRPRSLSKRRLSGIRVLKNLSLFRRRKRSSVSLSSKRISNYVNRVLTTSRGTEHRTIENFILCTREAEDSDYKAVQRNVRQFVDGMRNFIIAQHGAKLARLMPRRAASPSVEEDDEVPLESIIEATLQRHIVAPLHHHIYSYLLQHFGRGGDLRRLSENMKVLIKASPEEIGMDDKFQQLDWGPAIESLKRIQDHQSPVRKLRQLLDAVAEIHAISEGTEDQQITLSADDFLPLFVYVILQSEFYLAEVEAEYIWGLLDPALLNGEGGYYLTSLSSASHWLKNYSVQSNARLRVPCMDDVQGFLKIFFKSKDVSVVYKTFSVGRQDTAAETLAKVCQKYRLTDPSRYELCEVTPTGRRPLESGEQPQVVKASWPLDRVFDDHRIEFCDVTEGEKRSSVVIMP